METEKLKQVFSVLLLIVLCLGTLTFGIKIQTVKGAGTVHNAMTDSWPMFHHDLAHTGESSSTVPDTNQTLWTFFAGGAIVSSPTVADGIVYVGSSNNITYALNASTSALVWKYTTGNSIILSSAAVADGIVYIGSEDGDVYALNASTGTLVWNRKVGSLVWSSPTVANGIVYVGSGLGGNSGVDALNASTGTLVWSYSTGDEVVSSPAVDNGVLFVGSVNGDVYALNATDGTYIWSYQTGSYVVASAAVTDGVVYVETDGNGNVNLNSTTYALSASTGTLLWSFPSGCSCSPAVANGIVYAGGSDEKLYALNASTGACVWKYTTGEPSSPAIAGGLVLVGDGNYGKVYALDALTGALVWSYQTDGAVLSSPAVSDGAVFIGSNDGNIYAFGQPRFSVKVSSSSSALDVGSSQFFDSSVAGGVSPYAYQWYINGVPVSGADNPAWTFTPSSAGSYVVSLEVTDASDAVSTSNIIIVSVAEPTPVQNQNTTQATSSIPLGDGGSPPPTPGAPVYFSVEPVAVAPLINANSSVNGLEVSASPYPLGQDFTVDIYLRNATATNVPAGVAGVFVDFDFSSILNYCKPIGFTTMLGQPGGVFNGNSPVIYGLNGFYDVNGNPIDTASYAQATQYAVAAAIPGNAGWNNDDGIVARITFQITGQPSKALNQSDFYGQLHITFAELDAYVGASQEIPYNVVQGTLKIDDPITIPGDLNGDGKVNLADLVIFAKAYGSKLGDANWNPNADILGHGKVDLADLVTLANHYGQHYP
jgi:outer membrane protein assembly factor BamB